MRSGRIAAALALLGLITAGPAPAAAQTPTPSVASSVAPAVRATNTLALAMLRHLAPDTNAVVSPYSVQAALAMVDQGASGLTATQLDTLLGNAASPAALADANRVLSRDLHNAVSARGAGGPTLDSANGLWVQSGVTLAHPFATTLADDFGAAPQQADFASDAVGAAQTINRWISQRTAGLIPSLMSPAQITAQTELVLANAVYLNARWQTPFDPGRTRNGSFQAPSGAVTVPFMHGSDTGSYPYATGTAGTRYQAVALPYAHSTLELVAVMPPAGRLDALQSSLTPARLDAITTALSTRGVELSLPKFSLSFASSLNGFLKSQGVTQAFGPDSRLDRIVAGRSLAIQAVQHAARLTVAEKGTVAAAATGISVAPTAIAARGVVLNLDHPFLIFLRDTASGAILFTERVEDPSATA